MTKQYCISKAVNIADTSVLQNVPTEALVEELLKRDGVDYERIEPYSPVTSDFIYVEQDGVSNGEIGPCILIKVID